METVILQSPSKSKIHLLLKLAHELGISIVKKKKSKKTSTHGGETALLSQQSLAEAWDSPEDERWDDLYKK